MIFHRARAAALFQHITLGGKNGSFDPNEIPKGTPKVQQSKPVIHFRSPAANQEDEDQNKHEVSQFSYLTSTPKSGGTASTTKMAYQSTEKLNKRDSTMNTSWASVGLFKRLFTS